SLGKDIQAAYHAWQKLTPSCRWEMDMRMQKTLKGIAEKELYESMIGGFEIWERTQNMDGAPGWWIRDSSISDVLKHIGEGLLCLLNAMEEVWMNRKKESWKKSKASELRSAESEVCILTADDGDLMETSVGEGDGAITGFRDNNSSGMDAPQCLPSLSEEEKVEKFRKAHFEKEFDDVENQSMGESPTDTFGDDHHDDRNEPVSPNVSKSKDPMDFSLDEDSHLRNLRLSDCQDDSDVEKQISPLISDNEE
ncbi:hypothetical protein AVEN_166084-1, partial [Araneus ventricosus]